jgi:predicted nucleic acid-binding protein
VSDFVIDASVVLKWCFPDEHSVEAGRILDLMRTPGSRAVVPPFFHHEVLNALLMGERRNRITAAATSEFMRDVLTLPFSPVSQDAEKMKAIEDLSRKHALTAYDATYLELAMRLGLPLATFDKALLRASVPEAIQTLGSPT